MKKANAKEQLDALRNLAYLYSNAATFYGPRRFEHITFDRQDDGGLKELHRETSKAYREAYVTIRAARKKLLTTGFAVPDPWLTVHAVGQVGMKWEWLNPPTSKKRRAGKPKYLMVVTDTGADIAGLREACDEIHAAILRLEAREGVADDIGAVDNDLPALPTPRDWSKPTSKTGAATFLGISDDAINDYLRKNPSAARQASRKLWQFDKNDPFFSPLP
jgi:hypothetical protein